jgi:hypothetical protein
MRMTTLLSVAVLGVSTAALAQVSQSPQTNTSSANAATANEVVEDKVPPANMMATPSGNTADAAPPPGEPESSTSAPPRG